MLKWPLLIISTPHDANIFIVNLIIITIKYLFSSSFNIINLICSILYILFYCIVIGVKSFIYHKNFMNITKYFYCIFFLFFFVKKFTIHFDGFIRLIIPDFWLVIDSFKWINHHSEARKDQSDKSIKMDCSIKDTT